MDEITERLCANCGAAVPLDAQFCPKCGRAVGITGEPAPIAPPPAARKPAATPADRPRRAPLWRALAVPGAIVLLVVIIWAVLAGMPYGSRTDDSRPPLRPAVETIGEGTAAPAPSSPATATVSPAPQPLPPMSSTILMPEQQPPPPTSSVPPIIATPPPILTQPPMPMPMPAPATPPPQPETHDISATEAKAVLARYVDGQDPYHVPGNCLDIRGGDHSNHGYTFEVYDTCDSRRLGLWRVDGVTREVFEQKADGRYLRP